MERGRETDEGREIGRGGEKNGYKVGEMERKI